LVVGQYKYNYNSGIYKNQLNSLIVLHIEVHI